MLFLNSSRFARITTTTAIMCSVSSFAAAAQTAEQAPPAIEQAEPAAPAVTPAKPVVAPAKPALAEPSKSTAAEPSKSTAAEPSKSTAAEPSKSNVKSVAPPSVSIKSSDISIGAQVVGTDGSKIGVINRVSADASGKVTAIEVAPGGVAGLGVPVIAIPGTEITSTGPNVKLSVTADEAKKLQVQDGKNG